MIATFIEGSEGVNGSVWDQLSAEEWFPTEGLDGNAQPKGGFKTLIDDVARGLDIRLGAPATALAWNAGGVVATLASGERLSADRAVITLPVGLLRDGRFRLDPLPPPEQQAAIGRLGYGAGVLGKIYLRFPHQFWPDKSKWFGRLPDAPDRRGTFNTFVSHVEETGLPILLSFANGHSAVRYDRELDDEAVKQAALGSLRKMFGHNKVPEPEPSFFRAGSATPGRWAAIPTRDRQPARGSRRSCTAARQSRVLCRRGDRAGRVRHRACRPLVGRADGRGPVPRRHRCRAPRATGGRGPGRGGGRAGTMGDRSVSRQGAYRQHDLLHLVIVSGLATLGMLFAGLITMSRGPTNSIERARGSNKLMWWRVRLQALTIVFILLWWMTKS